MRDRSSSWALITSDASLRERAVRDEPVEQHVDRAANAHHVAVRDCRCFDPRVQLAAPDAARRRLEIAKRLQGDAHERQVGDQPHHERDDARGLELRVRLRELGVEHRAREENDREIRARDLSPQREPQRGAHEARRPVADIHRVPAGPTAPLLETHVCHTHARSITLRVVRDSPTGENLTAARGSRTQDKYSNPVGESLM
jgi:hypothetical protein